MYKKGKLHGEEYWMFKYCQLLCFQCSNVSNATTVFNSPRLSKGMFKIVHFLKITEEKKIFREYVE